MSTYEKILKDVRGFGYYQKRLFLLVSLLEISAAIAMVLPMFTHANVNWVCTTSNYSFSTNVTDINNTLSRLENQLENRTNFSYTVDKTMQCDASGHSKHCQDVNFSPEFTSIISEWNLICDLNYVINLINTATMVGLFLGGFITGLLSDFFGRKKVLFASFLLLLVFQITSGLVTSWQVYCVCRVFIGALITSVMISNFVLPMEFITPRWRTAIGCIGMWPVGIAFSSIWAYFIRDWRILTISTGCCGFPFLITWWFTAESPRWLMTHNRVNEAKKIIMDIARVNKTPSPDFTKLQLFIQEEEDGKEQQMKYTYWHLFNSCQMCKTTLILMSGWFISCSVYYGLLFSTNSLSGNHYVNVFLSGIVELPALGFVLLVNNKFGRKRTIILLFSIAGVSSISMLFLHVAGIYEDQPTLITVLAMLAKSSIAGGWAALQILTAESFPTVIRSLGVASCSMVARIGAILAIQVIALGDMGKIIPFVFFGIECLLCSCLLLCLPETSGIPLMDKLTT